jgi:hypothetical protein
MILLSAMAGTVAGCADSRLAANNAAPAGGVQASAQPASSQQAAAQPRPQSTAPQGMYGVSGGGYSKTIWEAFSDDDDAPAPVQQAQVQPGQIQQGQVPPGQPAGALKPGQVAGAARPGQPTTAAGPAQPGQPGQTVVASNAPQAPAPKPPPDTLGAYGIPSRGMTTNLYDVLFGGN